MLSTPFRAVNEVCSFDTYGTPEVSCKGSTGYVKQREGQYANDSSFGEGTRVSCTHLCKHVDDAINRKEGNICAN